MQGISIALVLLACVCLLVSVFASASPRDQFLRQGEASAAERWGGTFAVCGILLLCMAGTLEYLSQSVVYYSNKETLQTGTKVCAFVDTSEGKKSCGAFTKDELLHMEAAWSE